MLIPHNGRIDGLANGVIKVADFGLAEDMYGTNYYRRGRSEGGERVPIRWMAPESIEMNIYNESTDVVSYNYTEYGIAKLIKSAIALSITVLLCDLLKTLSVIVIVFKL